MQKQVFSLVSPLVRRNAVHAIANAPEGFMVRIEPRTRTVIALADILMRCNWAKRILFLADRIALVNQATGAFKTHLADSSPVNLVTEKDTESRVPVGIIFSVTTFSHYCTGARICPPMVV